MRNMYDSQNDGPVLPEIEEINWGYAKLFIHDSGLIRKTAYNFYKNIDSERIEIQKLFMDIDNPESLDLYRIKVHGMKSVAGSIGAIILFSLARLLEISAKEKDIGRIKTLHPVFVDELCKHESRLSVLDKENKKTQLSNPVIILPIIDMLKDSLIERDFDNADMLFEQIMMYEWPKDFQKEVNRLDLQITALEVNDAVATINRLNQMITDDQGNDGDIR